MNYLPERGWLIEIVYLWGSEWFDGKHWTDDSNKALRFSRKQDAERAMYVFGMLDGNGLPPVATEHMWVDNEIC